MSRLKLNKYVTQKNRYSCGAIALINLFKKIGSKKYFLKDVTVLNKKIKTNPLEGSEDINVVKFLRNHGFVCMSVNSIQYKALRRYLENGYEIIATLENEYYNHYSTIVGYDENGVYFSNSFTLKEMKKDKQPIKLLKKTVYFSNKELKELCYSKNTDLSIIFIRKP